MHLSHTRRTARRERDTVDRLLPTLGLPSGYYLNVL